MSETSIIVRPEDRTPDGNLLPEVRKRIVSELMEYSPSELMRPYKLGGALGVSAKTATLLAREAMIKRSVSRPYAVMIERDFLWQRIQDAMTFSEENAEQKIMKTRFIISLFRELDILNEAMLPEENETDVPQAYTIVGRIGPNMMRIFEEDATVRLREKEGNTI